MTGDRVANSSPPTSSDEEVDPRLDDPRVREWFGEHLPELRQAVSGQRLLYWSIAVGFVIGLGAHVAGYLLSSNATTEPLGLLADLLYALGYALWTGAVLVVFTQLYPEAKRRQIKRAIDHYEEGRREEAADKNDRTV